MSDPVIATARHELAAVEYGSQFHFVWAFLALEYIRNEYEKNCFWFYVLKPIKLPNFKFTLKT
jgi:hypothetical protein